MSSTKKSKISLSDGILSNILPFFDRHLLGLNLALLSFRFDSLVDEHFNAEKELTIFKNIFILKDNENDAELCSRLKDFPPFKSPLPEHPLHIKIRFKWLGIEYINHSVIKFLRTNKEIFDKGTDLRLILPRGGDDKVRRTMEAVKEIWPIFAPNIRSLRFRDDFELDNLLASISPTILDELPLLRSIDTDDLFIDAITDDGKKRKVNAGRALAKWLHTPTTDGQTKLLKCIDDGSKAPQQINNLKKTFARATSSVRYIVFLKLGKPMRIPQFELVNSRTQEKLTMMKRDDDHGPFVSQCLLKRCPMVETVQWGDELESTDSLNNVSLGLYTDGCIGPLENNG